MTTDRDDIWILDEINADRTVAVAVLVRNLQGPDDVVLGGMFEPQWSIIINDCLM